MTSVVHSLWRPKLHDTAVLADKTDPAAISEVNKIMAAIQLNRA
jgi:hypothetical protein